MSTNNDKLSEIIFEMYEESVDVNDVKTLLDDILSNYVVVFNLAEENGLVDKEYMLDMILNKMNLMF